MTQESDEERQVAIGERFVAIDISCRGCRWRIFACGRHVDPDQERYHNAGRDGILLTTVLSLVNSVTWIQLAGDLLVTALGGVADAVVHGDSRVAQEGR